jgi:hypothetical protein
MQLHNMLLCTVVVVLNLFTASVGAFRNAVGVGHVRLHDDDADRAAGARLRQPTGVHKQRLVDALHTRAHKRHGDGR